MANVAPPIVDEVLEAGRGRPLDARAQALMAPRFAHDFSAVRVHTDERAARSAKAVNAVAYTVGRDIVFGGGQYAPDNPAGQSLLAHELSHVVQQSGARRQPGPLTISDSHGAEEAQAHSNETRGNAISSAPLAVSRQVLSRQPAGGAGANAAAPVPVREVIAIRLGHRENGGLGRFDTLLYRDCGMKVQFRMNFNFTGPWPNESEKRSWQERFISSVRTAWSDRFDLEAPACASGCKRVRPFVEIYAPHNTPHVTVNVQHTSTAIISRSGYGNAHLDSLDLSPVKKGDLTDEERRREGVGSMTPAVHEFGHLTGRNDQYAPGGRCAPGYPLAGIMCFGNAVTEADYGPFANAASLMTGCRYAVTARRLGDFPKPQPSDTAAA